MFSRGRPPGVIGWPAVTFDPALMLGGLVVGFIVGLTGMGGGALMTPMLIFIFRIDPLMAVSSDVVASFFMKPAGAVVHLRRHTANLRMVGWLCAGSVPCAFLGAVLIKQIPAGEQLNTWLTRFLGGALIVAAVGIVVRIVQGMAQRDTALGEGSTEPANANVRVRPVPTLILGAVAGLMVGLTSVGAGSIVIVILLMLYPALKASQLVGTDLVQAVPLVGAASLGHLLYGDFALGVTTSLLIGAIPGAWLGAQVSSRAPGGIIRRVLAALLLASGMKMLGFGLVYVVAVPLGLAAASFVVWAIVRRRQRAGHAGGARGGVAHGGATGVAGGGVGIAGVAGPGVGGGEVAGPAGVAGAASP